MNPPEDGWAEDEDYTYSSDSDHEALPPETPSRHTGEALTLEELKLIGEGSSSATIRLVQEFRIFSKSKSLKDAAITASLENESLYKWRVVMDLTRGPFAYKARPLGSKEEPGDLVLAAFYADCRRWGVTELRLEALFPSDYPFAPPFVRVVTPRFAIHTGHVTVGGSICTDVLTPKGWSCALTAEDLFILLQSQIIEGEPRLDPTNQSIYYPQEARAAFERVAREKGWL
jgi:ubiquitin-conjugating enzyme E2 Q